MTVVNARLEVRVYGNVDVVGLNQVGLALVLKGFIGKEGSLY